MTNQETIDLYVQAVDLAKEKEWLGNQEKLLLNRFKMLLRSGAVSDAESEMAQIGKVRMKTLHSIRELAESIFEDWVRKLNVIEAGRDWMQRGYFIPEDAASVKEGHRKIQSRIKHFV